MEEMTLVHEGIQLELVPDSVRRIVLAQKLADLASRNEDGFEKAVRLVQTMSATVEGRKLLDDTAEWAAKHQLRPYMSRSSKVNPVNVVGGPIVLSRAEMTMESVPASPKMRTWVAKYFIR